MQQLPQLFSIWPTVKQNIRYFLFKQIIHKYIKKKDGTISKCISNEISSVTMDLIKQSIYSPDLNVSVQPKLKCG